MRWMRVIDRPEEEEELWTSNEHSLGSSCILLPLLQLLRGRVLSLSVGSRHYDLDSPSKLGIWVRSPLAWGRKSCARRGGTARAGRCSGGSILTLL